MFQSGKAFATPLLLSLTSLLQGSTDFTGTWTFDSAHSKNIGMMSEMRLTTVGQSTDELTQKIDATMMGQNQKQELRFDLTGKPVTNETPMGEKSQTTTKWKGDKLLTKWNTPAAVAGTTSVSVETRFLSPDGKTMYVETARANRPAVVMVYTRK